MLLALPVHAIPEGDTSQTMVFEKAYLHLDRDNYTSGEDIWFKAYLVDAMWNRLSENSRTL
jgi:hypothetical protein